MHHINTEVTTIENINKRMRAFYAKTRERAVVKGRVACRAGETDGGSTGHAHGSTLLQRTVHGPGKFSHAALLPGPCSGHAPHSALLNAALYVLPTHSLSAGSCILFRRHAAASPVRCPAQQSLERPSHHDAPPTAALEWHTREGGTGERG